MEYEHIEGIKLFVLSLLQNCYTKAIPDSCVRALARDYPDWVVYSDRQSVTEDLSYKQYLALGVNIRDRLLQAITLGYKEEVEYFLVEEEVVEELEDFDGCIEQLVKYGMYSSLRLISEERLAALGIPCKIVLFCLFLQTESSELGEYILKASFISDIPLENRLFFLDTALREEKTTVLEEMFVHDYFSALPKSELKERNKRWKRKPFLAVYCE